MIRSRQKRSLSAFFLMVFMLTLVEGSFHALLHADLHQVATTHSHHACSHSETVHSEDGETHANSPVESAVSDDSHNDTCARCVQFLVHEHTHIASAVGEVSTLLVGFFCSMSEETSLAFRVECPTLRGPPVA